MATMLFHAPYPVRGRDTGSGVRPAKMRDAFEDAGYEVYEVAGYGAERARSLRRIRRTRAAVPTSDGFTAALVAKENAGTPAAEAARALIRYLSGPAGRKSFADRGMEAPR